MRRIERYVTTAWSSGAEPVIVLNKADQREDLADVVAATAAVAPGVAVVTTTALGAGGLDPLQPYLVPGRTVALLGSSGVGKSTLVNRLLGEDRLATGAVSDAHAGRGRHTTTVRELVRLPGGAFLVDTPGLREQGLWADADALDRTFEEVDGFARACRFHDCGHHHEPGCAVRAAVDAGALDAERLASYLKLKCELENLEARKDEKSRRRVEKALGRDFAVRRTEVKRNRPRHQ
ncbi:MAG: ribosome small subunit-dependent GTPase A [Propionicimonas sp.]